MSRIPSRITGRGVRPCRKLKWFNHEGEAKASARNPQGPGAWYESASSDTVATRKEVIYARAG